MTDRSDQGAFDPPRSTRRVADEWLLARVRADDQFDPIIGQIFELASLTGSLAAAMCELGIVQESIVPLIENAAKGYVEFPENLDPFSRETVQRLVDAAEAERATREVSPSFPRTQSPRPSVPDYAAFEGAEPFGEPAVREESGEWKDPDAKSNRHKASKNGQTKPAARSGDEGAAINEEQLVPGFRLGQFVLERELGRGSSAVVWKAHDENLQMDVALKLLRVGPDGAALRDAFLKEARTVATLNHSNIVRVYNCGVLSGQVFIEMEFVDGLTLGEILRRCGRISPTLTIEAALCAAVALGHAGKEGFVHRDVKPDNIIVSRRGQVKIMDFGLGGAVDRSEDNSNRRSGLTGSPPYIAPELISQTGTPGVQTDIYALGATIFQLVTGRFPFEGRSIGEMLKQHLKAEPPELLSFAPGANVLNGIYQQMVRKDPAERYDDFRRVFMDLLNALHDQTETSFHESWGRGYFSRGLGLICSEILDGMATGADAANPPIR